MPAYPLYIVIPARHIVFKRVYAVIVNNIYRVIEGLKTAYIKNGSKLLFYIDKSKYSVSVVYK